jgi:hypothetical protein
MTTMRRHAAAAVDKPAATESRQNATILKLSMR